jgi:protein DJ-1
METTIIVDVLRRAGIEVLLAGVDGPEPVTCSRGVRILPDISFDAVAGSAETFDVIVLPGGAEGARRLGQSAPLGDILRTRAEAGALVAAICAAPTAFVSHGVFSGRRMTCHPSVSEVVFAHGLEAAGPVVEDGALITSQGPGTTFWFALAIVRRLVGAEKAEAVARPMLTSAAP